MKRTMMVMMIALVAISAGAWEILNDEDLMTGETILVAYVEASAHQGALRAPMLIMRSDGDVFVNWGGYSLDRDTRRVALRIGDGEPGLYPVTLSTTREATFFDDGDGLVEQAIGAGMLVVDTTTATGREMVTQFKISGIAEVWQSLTQER